MLLLVGLGNPGADYQNNRHNIGFMAADEIVRRHRLGMYRGKFDGLLADGTVAGERVLVLKPQTFMNRSGRSVGQVARFYKIPPTDVMVLHDELDLAPGKVRVKRGGGHGGHNGLRDIHAVLGDGYGRVRIGIGHPGNKERVTGHVLTDFSKADREWVDKLVDAIAAAFPDLAVGDDARFMNKVAMAMKPPRPNKPKPQGSVEEGKKDGV
ncbi:MAG: aminoacyl-tRNA hydrolase [Magnetospiraceae bacterium]